MAWHRYFSGLYKPASIPQGHKPWMTSKGSAMMRARTAKDNFIWPQTMSVEDLRHHLGHGNPRPSPGPDHWEKWALRQTTDAFLNLIVQLSNHMICTNYFPTRVKGNFTSPLYKRGDITDPRNYRGIVFANCIYNIVTSWFTRQFQRWIWRLDLLPQLQIATQQGVQPGDLTNFLDQADQALYSLGSTTYCIKRDHTKGFDNLHPQGFMDALQFYGINPAVAAFETARTTNVTLKIKLADGISKETITTTGQTKQGDHPSLIKYTMTMSMLIRWLTLLQTEDIPCITTVHSHEGKYHTPADRLQLKLLAVEAMDDSVMFGTSWDALVRMVDYSEQFQTAYGIQTAWESPEKTLCFTMGKAPTDIPTSIRFSSRGETHSVPFTENPKLLRTALHNQEAAAKSHHVDR